MEAPHLAANDIACRRGERVLFDAVSMELSRGEALHVTGPNGCGKSSLIRILAGLLRPLDGSVNRKGTIGLVDERLALDEHMPLGRALAFWETLDGCTATARSIRAMQLEDLLDVPVRYLSTGQRKRAALARLINSDSAIWMLDEPLNGLDREARKQVENLTARHCQEGGIAVIASHQPFELADMQVLHLPDHAR